MAKKLEKKYDPIPKDLEDLQNDLIEIDKNMKALEARKSEVQSKVLSLMQSFDLKKAENKFIRISYVAASTRKTFNGAKFQEDYADLYGKYLVSTETKPSVRITIKENE